jgi:hypothetical protein
MASTMEEQRVETVGPFVRSGHVLIAAVQRANEAEIVGLAHGASAAADRARVP